MMLLCDAAQSVGGKLYILGGGWTTVLAPPGATVSMALAVRLRIPWDRANDRFPVRAILVDADGKPVSVPGVPTIEAGGMIEVGRPPGIERGSPLDTMLALNFPNVPLNPATYVWNLEVENTVRAHARFQVRAA